MKVVVLLASALGLALGLPGPACAGDANEAIAAARGGTLHVALERGAVEITSHDEDVVRVSAHAIGDPIWRADIHLHAAADGEGIELTGGIAAGDGVVARAIAWAIWPLWPATMEVHVAVPREQSIVVRTTGGQVSASALRGRVTIETSGGAVEVRDVVGDVDARTAGGRIDVAGVAGQVRVGTSGGAITIAQVSGSVDAHTAGGRIDVYDAPAEIIATTSGGAIFSSFIGAPRGRLETSGGRIEVRVPVRAGTDLDARTYGGHVEVAEPLVLAGGGDRQHVVGRLNGGGPRLELRTSGGNIYVAPRAD